jgi:hypothetical protein
MKKSIFYSCFLLTILFTSCTSTKIVSSWKQPDKHVHMDELNKVLTIALIENEDNRYKAEHQIVKHLDGKGFVSHEYLDDNFNRKNETEIMNKIRDDGFDGIVLMRLIDVDKERVYIPSETNNYPEEYQNFGGFYKVQHYRYKTSGYYITTKTYILETVVFSLKDNKVVWTGITETFEPSGIKKMANEISKVVYKQMVNEKFIRK